MRVTVARCTWSRCELLAQTLEQITKPSILERTDWELVVVKKLIAAADRSGSRSVRGHPASARAQMRDVSPEKDASRRGAVVQSKSPNSPSCPLFPSPIRWR